MIWRPIETAPKDGTTILLGHERAVFDGWWDEREAGWVDGERNIYDDLLTYEPTHWMPLPDPPALSLVDKLDLLAERLNEK